MEEQRFPWREILETLFRRRRTVQGIGTLAFLAALASTLAQAPLYRSTSTLELRAQRGRVTVSPGRGSGVTVDRVEGAEINQQVELLQSPGLLRELAENVWASAPVAPQRLPGPRQWLRGAYGRLHGAPPVDPVGARVELYQERLQVAAVSNSNLIHVSYLAGDPQTATRFVNTLVARHTERSLARNQTSEALAFLAEQRALAAEVVDHAKNALEDYRQAHGIAHLPATTAELLRGMQTLEQERSEARARLDEVIARVAYLRLQSATLPRRINAEEVETESESVVKLRSALIELQLERSEKLSRYTSSSTVIRDLDRRINDAEQRLELERKTTAETRTAINPSYQTIEVELLKAEADLAALQARVSAIDRGFAAGRVDMDRLEASAPELARLENELANATSTFQSYLQKEEEARFSSALDQSRFVNLSVVEPAVPATAPESGGRTVRVLGLTLLGGLLGVGAAFLRDWLDPSVKSAAQAERITGVPVIAEISS